MIRVHSYGRFSTGKQDAEHGGDSERRQAALLQSFLDSDPAYSLSNLEPAFDRGKSSFRGDKQKALNKFLEILRAKDGRIRKGDVLFVENIDRLSRKGIRPTQDVVNSILNHGVDIAIAMPVQKIYRSEKINELGDAIELAAFAYAAHIYSSNLSTRIKRWYQGARAVAIKTGKAIPSGAPPAWLTRDKEGFQWKSGAKEAIKFIYRRTIEGIGGKRLCKELNEKFPCFGYSGKWNERYMRSILNDRRAMGEHQPHEINDAGERVVIGDPIPNYFPAAVDEDEWREANAAADNRRVERGPTTSFVNLFTGIVFHAADKCPCHVYTFQQRRADGRRIIYRRLKSQDASNNVKGASTETIYMEDFEFVVLQFLRELDTSVFSGNKSKAAELAGLTADLEKKRARITAIEEDESGAISLLAKQLAKLNGEVAELSKRIDSLKAAMQTSTASSHDHLLVLANLPETSENRQLLREAIKRVVARITILPVKLGSLRRSAVGSMIEIQLKNGVRRFLLQLGKSCMAYTVEKPENVSLFEDTEKVVAKKKVVTKRLINNLLIPLANGTLKPATDEELSRITDRKPILLGSK